MAGSKKLKKEEKISVPIEVTKKMIKENKVYEHRVKELVVYVDPNFNHLFKVKFNKGGKLPASVKGCFTSQHEAEKAIALVTKKHWTSTVKVK